MQNHTRPISPPAWLLAVACAGSLAHARAQTAPVLVTDFAGPNLTQSGGYFYPTIGGAVGPNHVVVSTNGTLAVYSKTGTAQYGPVPLYTFFFTLVLPARLQRPV